jgi:hypothetical protein
MSKRLPKTTAHICITAQSWQAGKIEGQVSAGDFTWDFQWRFRQKQLNISPSKGRALIQEPLGRFLEAYDYQLEPGSDYWFTIRAQI